MLISGTGSLLQALLDASSDPGFPAVVVGVVSDSAGAAGLARAADLGVPTRVVAIGEHPDRTSWDEALRDALESFEPDWVISAGFMRLLGPLVLSAFPLRVVNTHPALLPSFPGTHAVRDALAHGVRVTGSTIHLVDDGVDTGPIIDQRAGTGRGGRRRVLAARADQGRGARAARRRRRASGDAQRACVRQKGDLRMTQPSPTPAEDRLPVRRALVSVYDKTGLDELAQALHAAGVEIVSTGSTAARITQAGVPVVEVAELTEFPECLDGRVKTLHPRVHAGILADLRRPEHRAQLAELGVEPFGLVVVNLYPFVATVMSGASQDECVEQIDIGGPSMVRAAAKNHPSVAVVTSPASYSTVVEAVAGGGFTLAQRQRLASEAFVHTANYDIAVASWMGSVVGPTDDGSNFPAWVGAGYDRAAVLRYGENPHQRAALYASSHFPGGLAVAEQLHGKEMSYNNYVDADAARRAAYDFAEPAVAIIKHANPCGIAIGADIAEAHARAHETDPVSAFGGVIAANRPVTAAMARQVAEVFTEVIVAPAFEPEALELLTTKKNLRILVAQAVRRAGGVETRPISGGLLMQSIDHVDAPGDDPAGWTLACGAPADAATLADLELAWRAVRSAKSNAILLAKDGAAVGIGMGQVNRVDSARLAVARAGEDRARGSVAASDAFFPFPDGLRGAARGRSSRGRPAGRLGPRRRGDRRSAGRRDHDVPHRHPALLPLTARADRLGST